MPQYQTSTEYIPELTFTLHFTFHFLFPRTGMIEYTDLTKSIILYYLIFLLFVFIGK